jgi:hypothetical protein
MIGLHAGALPLAVFDVALAKDSSRLSADGDLLITALLCFSYLCLYVGFIAMNFRVTGGWPYGVLKDLQGCLARWSAFLILQTSLLILFAASLFALSHLRSSLHLSSLCLMKLAAVV